MQNQNTANNKRIAKNTAMLYFRMILTMLVSLYTVRVVLNVLGVTDYGIYNVIGGFVSMMSFLSGTMSSASQRFFAFELGKNNHQGLKESFSASLTIFFILGFICFILFETIGLWFLNTQMIIPNDRLSAANWVYQFSILSFILTILVNPFNAAIIAHEDMKIYAYISVIEVIFKLVIVYLLLLFPYDKLELYGFLILGVTTIISLSYVLICIRRYPECNLRLRWNITIIKPIAHYAGWNTIGAVSNILKGQGVNVLLNVFFGPIVNTARGIAFQVNNAFNSFIVNIYMAVRPQITKAYAIGDREYMMELVFKSAKASYFLLMILSMPFLLETNFLLNLWLNEVPEYTVTFTRLLVVCLLIEAINNQLFGALQASGKIKTYQIFICSIQVLILPVSYLLFYFGAAPDSTLYVSIIATLFCFIPQLIISKKIINLSISLYLKEVVGVIICVTIISYILPLGIYYVMDIGYVRCLLVCFVGIISSLTTIYYLGLTKEEKFFLIKTIKNKILKKAI